MGKEEGELKGAMGAYRRAKGSGNREEEARWANVIGNILKNRGQYLKALKWLLIDFDISTHSHRDSFATCQSLGEVYLRLLDYATALTFQEKHLNLAKAANNTIEMQRAYTQLGRTYHEIFLKSEDDHASIRKAKEYFGSAMKLARTLQQNPLKNGPSHLKEYIDAHNNCGMLEMNLDNYVEAEMILSRGLQLCDEDAVSEDDDGRSRLHHNLGTLYLEMRDWGQAVKHITKDIKICKRIGQCQGEAKGFINLGEMKYRVQRYDEAITCYQKALNLVNSMEDEDALAEQINRNIATVKEAVQVAEEIKKEEQNFKELKRKAEYATGKPNERGILKQQMRFLGLLIDKSSMIFAWEQHCRYAKCKKQVAKQLLDKQILGDSFLVLGESYLRLRNFNKALKWVTRSLETYERIRYLEGQAVAKNSIGNVLDSDGRWMEALNAYKESHRIAVEANLASVQLSALENMHYSYMIRFDDVEKARRLQLEISNLKQSTNWELETVKLARDYCSETDTDGDDHTLDDRPNESNSLEIIKSTSRPENVVPQLEDDVPLILFVKSLKLASRKKKHNAGNHNTSAKFEERSPKWLSNTSNRQAIVGRKRASSILSDDEDEMNDENLLKRWTSGLSLSQHVATSNPFVENNGVAMDQSEGLSTIGPTCSSNFSNPSNIEESCASSKTPKIGNPRRRGYATGGFARRKINYTGADINLHHFAKNHKGCIRFRIHDDDDDGDAQIDIGGGACLSADKTDIESMKVELACLCFLHLPSVNPTKGLFPIIKDMKYDGKVIESLETYDTIVNGVENVLIEVSLIGWVYYRHIKRYVDCCEELLETPNMKLMKKLYISGDEGVIDASESDLQDVSITPLINALHKQNFVIVLDLSHNTLGTKTMEKLQELFLSGQKYKAFALDLHCNRFGASALNQICECPAFFSGLHILNISGNHLTDECGIVLSALIQKCRALHSLNISQCSITSTTVEMMANVITSGLVLEHLSIGYNDLSGSAIVKLLTKLASLERFQELNLNGIEICRLVIDSLCKLAERPCVSGLMLRGSNIGNDGAVQLTESLFRQHHKSSVKLDLSYCNLTGTYIHKLKNEDIIATGFTELIYEGNTVQEETLLMKRIKQGMKAMTSLVRNRLCGLRVVVLNKCELEVKGVARVMEALSENKQVAELHLSHNVSMPISSGDVEELSRALGKAKRLEMLDLSHNGIEKGDAEALFGAWASRSGSRLHFQDHILHLSTDRTPCCGICCPYSRPSS